MRAQSQGLYVHAVSLSAIHVAKIWASVGAGPCDGCDHGGDASGYIWRAGIGRSEVPGFFDRVSSGDDLDWESGRGVVSDSGGMDDCAGGDGVNTSNSPRRHPGEGRGGACSS
jgi:hypothetical protein